jgi:hypothetical protein
MNGDDWRKRYMFSDESWRSLTKHYPGLEKQPPAISRMAFDIVEWEKNKKLTFKASIPSERKASYSDAAKKIRSAIEAVKVACNTGESNFEVFPPDFFEPATGENSNFVQNLVNDLRILESLLANAECKQKKSGPNNGSLKTYVWLVADWFERNGRSDRISAGEDSHSIKVFIKDIFNNFNFIPQDRALADAIRSYPKKRG